MKYIMILALLGLTSCFNKASVPETVETCFKDEKTGKCTTELTVRHIITIEVPVALVNDCVEQFKDLPEPDKTLQTQACIQKYTDDLINLIKGITPVDVPPTSP